MINKLISKTQVRLLEYDGNPSQDYKDGYCRAIHDVLELDTIPTLGADEYEKFKPDYETRLKADMIVMLEELKEQLREMHEDFFETEHFDEAYGISDSMDVIQKRINDLVGKDGNIREERQNEKSN